MPYKIIVADPSPSVRKAVELALPEPEFRIFVFEDGGSLLESVTGVGPDALLISLTLPGRDGYDVARTLRSRKELATVPLIGLRGSFECLDSDKTTPPDYDDVLPKPFDSERLATVVRELIARKTGPASLPEQPVRPGSPAKASAGSPGGPAAAASEAGPSVREIVREEIGEMEREIEKRVRARVLADLKDWKSNS